MPYSPEAKEIDINSSAAELRNYTLAFVSFLLYVLITATSTTHEQLLRISTVKLPLLNIDIPIVQFYLVSPLLILILHFHLLLQHFLFSQQYYIFDQALRTQYPDHSDRERFMKKMSGNLSLVHLFGGYQKPFMQLLLISIVAICLLIFPLFDLWFLQAKFLPFHDTDYTNWQCLMVVIDCLMLLILLPKILDEKDNAWQWWKNMIVIPMIPIYKVFLILFKITCQLFYKLSRLFLIFLQRFFHHSQFARIRAFVNTTSLLLEALKNNLQVHYQTIPSIRTIPLTYIIVDWVLLIFSAAIFILSVFVSTLPQFEYKEKQINYPSTAFELAKADFNLSLDLFINDREKWLLQYIDSCPNKESDKSSDFCYFYECSSDASKFNYFEFTTNICKVNLQEDKNRESLLLTARLHEKIIKKIDNSQSIVNEPFLYRNLNLSEKIITADTNLSHELENTLNKNGSLEKIAGIDLKKRDLRYTDFSYSKLPKADLRKANLQGANLFNTELHNAKLGSADLQDANLFNAELKNAELQSANLQSAYLREAKLQDFNLASLNLKNADLVSAKLQGADLSLAQLQGADMESVKLQGANLKGAQLQNAKMKSAELQGANLEDAELQGAFLQETHLESAMLRKAKLKDAILLDAHLEGADLTLADLNLNSGIKHSAYLQGANLTRSNLKGVYLEYVHLQGANLALADLQESILSSVELQGADLSSAKLIKSQFQQDIYSKTPQLQGAFLENTALQGANLANTELQGAYLAGFKLDDNTLSYIKSEGGSVSFDYSDYIKPETKESTPTLFPIDTEKKSDIRCLTNDPKLPICKQISDKENSKKVESYLVHDLACSDKWIAYGIMRNYSDIFNKKLDDKSCPAQAKKKIADYLVNDLICSDKWIAKGMIRNGFSDDLKPEVISLLNKKLTDKSCQGIQELPDEIKQQIQKEAKLLMSSSTKN